ncbi:MAG: hypothetical protein ACK55I_34330, partial [bacterium]
LDQVALDQIRARERRTTHIERVEHSLCATAFIRINDVHGASTRDIRHERVELAIIDIAQLGFDCTGGVGEQVLAIDAGFYVTRHRLHLPRLLDITPVEAC